MIANDEQEWLPGWKVTIRWGSWFVGPSHPAYCTYQPGTIAERPSGRGPLAVFDCREAAYNFAGGPCDEVRLQAVAYLESIDKRLWVNDLEVRTGVPNRTRFADVVYVFEEPSQCA